MKEHMNIINTPENIFADNTAPHRCCKCGKEFKKSELIEFEGKFYCKDCYDIYTVVCDDCGQRVHIGDTESDSEKTICYICAQYYSRCCKCDSLVPDHKVHRNEDGDCFCSECWNHCEYDDNVHSYSYKPVPVFHSRQRKKRFFGTEIEVDRAKSVGGKEISELVTNHIHALAAGSKGQYENNLYLKSDHSLNYGFEMVSHPMTLDYHLHCMPWAKIMDFLVEVEYISDSSETCGLHFHVNRDSFGDSEEEQDEAIARILVFVENNWDKILKFSRRTEKQMNRWAARYGTNEPNMLKERIKNKAGEKRYTCINLKNRNTVEFRMFKGTLKYPVFVAALQLVNAICDVAVYCSDEEVKAMDWTAFIKGLDAGSNKELISYLKEKNLYL